VLDRLGEVSRGESVVAEFLFARRSRRGARGVRGAPGRSDGRREVRRTTTNDDDDDDDDGSSETREGGEGGRWCQVGFVNASRPRLVLIENRVGFG
jgi:hypothetical protein